METEAVSGQKGKSVSIVPPVDQERKGENVEQWGSIREILCDMLHAALNSEETTAEE